MGSIMLTPKYKETRGGGNGPAAEKLYILDGTEIIGQVSPYAVGPLRILGHILKKKGINYQKMINDDDPWSITQMLIDDKYADFVKVALEEIMEYRCAVELGGGYEEIIRQLPFEVAMQTSDNIIGFGKQKDEQYTKDQIESDRRWREFNAIYGYTPNGNPNETIDNLEISKENPVLRKHLIYTSARGGYNIKTKGYNDRSLDHHSYVDSNKYD